MHVDTTAHFSNSDVVVRLHGVGGCTHAHVFVFHETID